MGNAHGLQSDLSYLRNLVGAGWEGISSAREGGAVFAPLPKAGLWGPGAFGAIVGMMSAGLLGNRKNRSALAVGGLLGSAVGLGAAAAWASRHFTGLAARNAVRSVNAARDAHWLEQNPIDYA